MAKSSRLWLGAGLIVAVVFGLLFVRFEASVSASQSAAKVDAKLFQSLRYRSIGPARGGRQGRRVQALTVLTLVVTASGVSLLGIGAPFWGLVAGLSVLGLDRLVGRRR